MAKTMRNFGAHTEPLSPLEKDVLELLWEQRTARVRDIYGALKGSRKVASTSVAVILDRLHTRKLVSREIESCRGGFRYIYTPRLNKEQFHEAVIGKAVDSLIHVFGDTAIAYFTGRFGKGPK